MYQIIAQIWRLMFIIYWPCETQVHFHIDAGKNASWQPARACSGNIGFERSCEHRKALYCVAYRTMRRIYKTLKAGVSFVKLITNNNCETLVREQCELPMPLNNWALNVQAYIGEYISTDCELEYCKVNRALIFKECMYYSILNIANRCADESERQGSYLC